MALQLWCYLTMRRFNDLQNIKVEDISVLADGDLRIFQKVGNTFQMGQGHYFCVLNKLFGGFTAKSLMDRYVLKLGLKSNDFLFIHFAKSSTGVMSVCRVFHWVGKRSGRVISSIMCCVTCLLVTKLMSAVTQ